jgi:hypothetical protein
MQCRNWWQRVKFAFSVWLQDPTLHPLNVHPVFDVDACERMFVRNQTLLHDYAKSVGGCALTYLQPCNGFGRRPISPNDAAAVAHLRRRVSADGSTELDAIDAFYRRAAADFQQWPGGQCVDLTTIFDHVRSNVYIDQVHCSDLGYDLIARRIADDILAREPATAQIP